MKTITKLFTSAISALGHKLHDILFALLVRGGLILCSAPMRSTDFRSVVEPILNDVFDGVMDQRKDEYKLFMDVITGTPRSYHEEPVLFGFGSAPELPDGEPVVYRQGGQLYVKRYVYKMYGLAFALTKVLVQDGDHIRIGKIYSEHLAQSMIETQETKPANDLNFAFTVGVTGGDGVSLCNAAHPINGGTYSNLLASPAALSQTSVEQMLVQIRNAVDDSGKKTRVTGQRLVVAPANQMQAEVIVNSVLRSAVANNDINPVKSLGLLPKETAVVSRLTSPTAWFIKTDARRGMQFVRRMSGPERSMLGDFDTDSMRYKMIDRFETGWTNARSMFGTPGL